MKVTLGGDRLGSGNKNKIALHDYERSTHNLSQKFTSSLQCGTLYPFLVLPAMRGDKFEIDLDAAARTIPTKGPLFGSFKLQVDLFQCDVRLYQAILHNNPLAIGLKMNQVKFPQLLVRDSFNSVQPNEAFSNTSLLKYLGLSGLGILSNGAYARNYRSINAIPALAYYEIFKTYYSNKQEENAYVIGDETITYNLDNLNIAIYDFGVLDIQGDPQAVSPMGALQQFQITNEYAFDDLENNLTLSFIYETVEKASYTLKECKELGIIIETNINNVKAWAFNGNTLPNNITFDSVEFNGKDGSTYQVTKWGLQPFNLTNIDDMRLALLSHHQLGVPFAIGEGISGDSGIWNEDSGTDQTGLPYINLVALNRDADYDQTTSKNRNPLNGLVVKTYQSDLFNNWVNTEWIDGENGIAEITAISTASGEIKIDSINLSEKLYNMLNRIAVSDGSYEGWQDAVYTETPKRHIESPVYLGGMSSEIMFEEIVQTSTGDETNPLGTLGGKGILIKNKGGKVTVKVNEAAFIIGIVSLTPRVMYCQGNEWYLTELQSMDDFHKPALDGIGFQNLLGERLAWWDTKITDGVVTSRSVIGKVPAWIEYMTAVDKCYGDFAETEGRGFMALQRDYGRGLDNTITDATTYIDPRKYNYAFAYTGIDAQNFWVQINSRITARRLMSAKQIPNI